jgi:pimeloyl-ACP methyl ester carboxylesterase
MQQVTSGRATLAVDVVGGGQTAAGPDVLLMHAGVTDRRSWRPVMERLSSQVQCISFDARGFGETAYEPEPGWSPVDDAVCVLAAVGSHRAVVVGSSSGGQVAIDLALAHPDRIAGLVLIAPAVRGAPYPDPTEREISLEGGAERAQAEGDMDRANALEAQLWLDGPTSAEGRVGGHTRELFLDMNGRALRSVDPGPTAVRDPAWPKLGEIGVPTLVLVGDLDVSDLQAIGRLLAAALPDATFTELPGVAHLPQMEAPEVLAREIGDFLDRLGVSSS